MRHTDNSIWWSGAVMAHPATDNLADRVDAAERFYAERNAVSRFQICSDCPAALDGLLAQRGYRLEAPIALLTISAGTATTADPIMDTTVSVDAVLVPEWLAVFQATSDPNADVEHEVRPFGLADREQRYVTVFADHVPVGIGRAVADGDWTGVFNMATIPVARRRGAARTVLSAIADWARSHGAPNLYLQVEQSNDGARRLYEAAGFTELATYHYRVRG